ncbi:MAG: DnaJ domain-containing protein [Alphaproteobacteria bacterium]|jgi:hypothetical protein|nr:DnaJ domain-containing protein [Alphaproteobacteria bacterium]MDP6563805.1 DnaJ domain-containing protein [Alphaproteobacteria bacterium]MDP6811758.1 DnaJ domain-containing protein [Alphaproteobacteria bacterium]
MIGYFILGICLLAAALLVGRWLVSADPRFLAKVLRYSGFGLLAATAVFFMLTGRFGWGLPLAFIALTMLRRWRLPNLGPGFGLGRKPSQGRSSDVETDYLHMTLEHDTGVMAGRVQKGAYAGKNLAELALPELVELLAECHREDPEAAQLLEAYLDRTAGGDWREAAQASAGGGGRPAGDDGAGMTVEEAREILGVAIGASANEIREAHRRLMLKLHPDTGGSDYLAAKINQAKDLLLGN